QRDPKINWRNPGFEQTDDHPVVVVTRGDAQAFCDWLSKKEGRYYTLPTEAQWEYACRAGSRSRFSFGDNEGQLPEHAWIVSNSDHKTHPVGKKKPNAWGLFDMHGNAAEWCLDWYDRDYYARSPRNDPPGPLEGKNVVCRGSGW